jgi:hypothetical protein
MPVFRRYLSLLACAKVHFFCTQGSRVQPASGIPCALSVPGASIDPRARANPATRTILLVIARSEATKQSISPPAEAWIASRSLSSGAHSRDPLARNDEGLRSNALPAAAERL